MKETDFSEIIDTGIPFIAAITNHFGTETGFALWTKLCESMPTEVRDGIFLAMLSGDTVRSISIVSYTGTNKIERIKAIRTVSGYGLKEAKDLDDKISNGTAINVSFLPEWSRGIAVNKLRNAGYII